MHIIKAELPQEGILFHTQFPSLGLTDIIKVVLVFSISNFFIKKIPGKEIECEIKYLLAVIQL